MVVKGLCRGCINGVNGRDICEDTSGNITRCTDYFPIVSKNEMVITTIKKGNVTQRVVKKKNWKMKG